MGLWLVLSGGESVSRGVGFDLGLTGVSDRGKGVGRKGRGSSLVQPMLLGFGYEFPIRMRAQVSNLAIFKKICVFPL